MNKEVIRIIVLKQFYERVVTMGKLEISLRNLNNEFLSN